MLRLCSILVLRVFFYFFYLAEIYYLAQGTYNKLWSRSCIGSLLFRCFRIITRMWSKGRRIISLFLWIRPIPKLCSIFWKETLISLSFPMFYILINIGIMQVVINSFSKTFKISMLKYISAKMTNIRSQLQMYSSKAVKLYWLVRKKLRRTLCLAILEVI